MRTEPLREPAAIVPEGFEVYKTTPEFGESTIPDGLLRAHATKAGIWGRICVMEGTLRYTVVDSRRLHRERLLTPGTYGVIEPSILHHVAADGQVKFYVEFLRLKGCPKQM